MPCVWRPAGDGYLSNDRHTSAGLRPASLTPRQTRPCLGSVGLYDTARPGPDAAVSSFFWQFSDRNLSTRRRQALRLIALQQRDRPLYGFYIPKVTTIYPFDLQE